MDEFDPLKIASLIEVEMRGTDGRLRINTPSVMSFLNKETVVIKDLSSDDRFDFSNTKKFDEQHNYKTHSMMVFPCCRTMATPLGFANHQLSSALFSTRLHGIYPHSDGTGWLGADQRHFGY